MVLVYTQLRLAQPLVNDQRLPRTQEALGTLFGGRWDACWQPLRRATDDP